ncbi:cell division protein FtsW [Parabacteroides sp. PF5-5]|uniref:FtsW/RodA/SpoVE family cell cycle protein n=1 Tax=unclassified Parabacteroides TaxID=2649774 RepID=UPI002476B865|nr:MULTISPECIES: FtsW/RodA/SpoVE family cell cycle protein [unclassified Parabacteroides]MDH6303374.1 cell division protein FtsW [Parabacteroides sp. PH5-39]MDH6314697.1 cell division protein FtsW [Parabacteroides sp. PF5-13]MDH6318034.1 cell division protein FtsW [Parabacteroides sp. PH5-13]MDH6322035.1 cell division protein FtsW [Parabacteroides sp. PH5-8]MDH6326158.1 cell division protein FtsW [Parabacteroides sp. PH5-41]
MELANKLFKGDRVVWIIFMFLCLISVVEVFSATSILTYKNTNFWAPIARHASFLLAGFVLVLILHNVPCRFFSALILLLPVSAILLLLTPFLGAKVNDTHRFMEIFGVSFQPSELAKLACVVFVAFLLSKQGKITKDQIFNYGFIAVAIICMLIFPENFSTSVMLFGVCFLMMFIGQMPLKKLGLLFLVLVLTMSLLVALLFALPNSMIEGVGRLETMKSRIAGFFIEKPKIDPATYKITDDNYQVSHAQIAIARGGVFGKMPGHGQQRDFLPQAYSDFIYAIIIEELGVVGGFFVLLLYVMLMIRVGIIARRCDRLFPRYLVLGCGLLITIQAFANMAVAVGLFPVTGQPLPLVSRGGTSTVITCVYIGIILSVSRFGAGMGDEEEETEEENSDVIEIDTDIADDSSLTAVETLTEIKS